MSTKHDKGININVDRKIIICLPGNDGERRPILKNREFDEKMVVGLKFELILWVEMMVKNWFYFVFKRNLKFETWKARQQVLSFGFFFLDKGRLSYGPWFSFLNSPVQFKKERKIHLVSGQV